MPDTGSGEGSALQAEFIQSYSRDQGRLFRYVAALIPNLHDAEDVMSEITVVLWSQFANFEPGTNFLAWARRIAQLRILEYNRNRNRRMPDALLTLLATDTERRNLLADRRLSFLAECRQQLLPNDQRLLERRYCDNVPVQELANELGRPANSVSKSLGRIRQILLDCIARKMAANGH